MVRDDVVLGLHHLREPLNAERLGVVRVDEQDVGAGRDGVSGLDVECDLERPRALVLEPGPAARLRIGRRRPVDSEFTEPGHPCRAGDPLLAAHRREAERLVEHVEVVRHGVAAVRVDDGDGPTPTVQALRVERSDVVGGLDRLWREARAPDRLAVGLRRRRRASLDELEVGDRRQRHCLGPRRAA